ncbi:MAG: hypothetical protein K0S12_1240 [Bacteroidetes bacterium]|jgi:uncharacterized protein YciI|nr:hypothetical protein [Bacteroidota bacterium]
MKKLNFTLVFVFAALVSLSQTKKETVKKPKYDAALAKKLQADDHGMHKYVIAFLKAGPNRNQDSATAAQLQAAHMANIGRMAENGDLVLAGPFMDKGELRGIYIFNVESIEKAKELTESDPAVKAGRLIMELHPWYGSAALMQVNEIHNKIQKKDF